MTARAVALRVARRIGDVSLLSVGRAFDDAAAALRAGGVHEAGVHLCVVGGEAPLSDPGRIPSLLRGGRFRGGWPRVAAATATGRISPREVEEEWEAQIARVRSAGLTVTHLDGHQHLHLLPRLLPVVLALAKRFDVPFVRAPRSDDPAAMANVSFVSRGRARLLSRFGAAARKAIAAAGLPAPPRVLGLAEAGGMTLERWRVLLAALCPGDTFEVVLHPGASDDETRNAYRWGYSWSEESEALESEELPAIFRERGIATASFSELG